MIIVDSTVYGYYLGNGGVPWHEEDPSAADTPGAGSKIEVGSIVAERKGPARLRLQHFYIHTYEGCICGVVVRYLGERMTYDLVGKLCRERQL